MPVKTVLLLPFNIRFQQGFTSLHQRKQCIKISHCSPLFFSYFGICGHDASKRALKAHGALVSSI